MDFPILVVVLCWFLFNVIVPKSLCPLCVSWASPSTH